MNTHVAFIINKDVVIKTTKQLKELVERDIAVAVVPNTCVNVLYDCPKCDEHIDAIRFEGEPLKFCPNCGTKFKVAKK